MARKSPSTSLRDASYVAADLRLTTRDVYSIDIDSVGTRMHLSNEAFKRVFRKVSDERSAIKVSHHRESIQCKFTYRSTVFVCVLMGQEVEEFKKSIELQQGRIEGPASVPLIDNKPGQQLLLTDNR